MPHASHEDRLDRLAMIAVQVGLGLQTGQQLVITAPLDAVPLVRRVTEHAYRAGASLVTTLFDDDAAMLARFRLAPDAGLDTAPGWLFAGMAAAFQDGAARLAITGGNPGLLAGEDAGKVARANAARSAAWRPALEQIAKYATNWSIVPNASPAWASMIFPDQQPAEAEARLWEEIFAATRIDTTDPAAAWAAHNAALEKRTATLNDRNYAALHFHGPGTDVYVGLAEGHLWRGGAIRARNGIVCNPNIPTEEVFTTPHRSKVDGYARSTKPLALHGTVVRDIVVRFEAGRITEARARTGQDVFRRLLGTDEGAARLGEVALVPASSPIAASGTLFFNTLFDENAASHVAVGQSFSSCMRHNAEQKPEELLHRGANTSQVHVDWMIGSAELDVDGIGNYGQTEAVMRGGEWV